MGTSLGDVYRVKLGVDEVAGPVLSGSSFECDSYVHLEFTGIGEVNQLGVL